MRSKRNIENVSVINFRDKMNKRGGVADLVSLFTATIVIAIILISFVVLSGLVKIVEKDTTGKNVYDDGEVGVGEMKYYMWNYGRLVRAEGLVREGGLVDDVLVLVDYKRDLDIFEREEFERAMANSLGGRPYGP